MDTDRDESSSCDCQERLPTGNYDGGAIGPGAQIGPYKLLCILGEGGYGIVFLAEQQRPVKRRVALKVIKPGMDTKQVIARFEAERQALALLDHPNIAHVFSAGTTEAGRPCFATEHVRGLQAGVRMADKAVSRSSVRHHLRTRRRTKRLAMNRRVTPDRRTRAQIRDQDGGGSRKGCMDRDGVSTGTPGEGETRQKGAHTIWHQAIDRIQWWVEQVDHRV